MPVSYEPLNVNTDVTTTKTILHEVIPMTGTVINSGTYNNNNIKNYTHGMFQSVYDYPYLSSSANHIFDITVGYDETSALSASTNVQNNKKINMYNQFSQVLLGYTGSSNTVRMFENDLRLDQTGSMRNVMILSLSRLLTKDQIKKGTFTLQLGTGPWGNRHSETVTLQDSDADATGDGTTNTIGGDYGVLKATAGLATGSAHGTAHGIIFYQAGIAIISSSVFDLTNSSGYGQFASGAASAFTRSLGPALGCSASLATGSISSSADALRERITNLTFNNSTEINSTIYFCRLPVNKFNYSANPTYLSASKLRVKNRADDLPVAYATTVGLYNARNELLAVAKLSEPLKKTPQNELTIRVRLDY